MKRTEVVTADGEFAYPSLDYTRNNELEVWVRTESGKIKKAECTIDLYKMKSFTHTDKVKAADCKMSPFDM